MPVTGRTGQQADVASIVSRYVAASASAADRVVGHIQGSLSRVPGSFYRPLDYVVADAQLAATRAPDKGGAQFALMNRGGIRTYFEPGSDGSVTYGQIFALQPFGNTVSVIAISGADLRAGLEHALGREDVDAQKAMLIPSANLHYSFDYSRHAGSRLVDLTLDGKPIDPAATYRVAANNFIASGGDGFTFLAKGKPVGGGTNDLDALETYIAKGIVTPQDKRVQNLTP